MTCTTNKDEIVYQGYSYDQEVITDSGGKVHYRHFARDEDGYCEQIPWAMTETISPSEFRFLVDHDFPTLVDFQQGNRFPLIPGRRFTQDGIYNSYILSRIRAFMEERGCETVEMTAIMIKLSGWRYWDEIA